MLFALGVVAGFAVGLVIGIAAVCALGESTVFHDECIVCNPSQSKNV
jgi:hypothetical protein